ncbi:hypothetical protein NYA8BAC_00378 [Psychrobacter okhotskensis]
MILLHGLTYATKNSSNSNNHDLLHRQITELA